MRPPPTLYITDREIPLLGAQPGDLVLIRPAHATDPLMIIRRFDRNILPTILDEFERLRPVSQPRLRRRRNGAGGCRRQKGETFSREVVANP